MADRTIFVRIKGDVRGLTGALAKAKTDVRSFASDASRSIAKNREEWSMLSTTVGLMGGALVGMSALAVRGFASFDKSMSKVKATGADAANSIDALRDAAIRAGADTMYSATQAADGVTALLKAGVSAKDVLSGGLTGALNLAASGEMDVAAAAESTATALNQFGLSGDQASHVADLLAAGANAAQGEVSDMAMALAQGGLVAHQTGLSIEETVSALTLFAKAGMIGSDSGTSLKTMLQRLTPQSAEAAKEFQKLGISAYDSSGKFVGLVNFSGQLHDQMKNLTPEARNAALSVMFGADAVRGASVLYEAGASGAQRLSDAINQQGFAARQAAVLTDNLSGDVERLGGSVDTVFIQSGSGANSVLREMAQGATSLVNAIGQIPGPLLSVSTLLTGSGGIGLAGAAGMMKLVGGITEARTQIDKLGKAGKLAKIAVGGIGGALALGTIAFAAWADAQAKAQQNTSDLASTLVVMGGQVVSTSSTVDMLKTKIIEANVGIFGMTGQLTTYAGRVGLTYDEMIGYIEDLPGAVDKVEAKFAAYNKARNGWGMDDINNVREGLNGLKSSQAGAVQIAKEQAKADAEASTSASTYADALAKSATTADDATSSLKTYADQLFKSANAALKASGTQVGWEAALDDTAKAVKKTGQAHRTASGDLDLNTKAGRENQTALNQLAQASVAYAQSLIEQGASQDRIEGAMTRSRDAFIKQATAAGMTKTAAKKLADAYGLIPSDVNTNIAITGGDKSATKLAIIQAAIADLPPEQKIEILTAFDKGGIKAADAALNKINGKHVTTYVDIKAVVHQTKDGKKYTAKAGGGEVDGPGTGTSDSIPALLSNGEHVLTASDVSKAGGQGAIYRLRAGIQAGIYRFADGGGVEYFAKGGAAKKRQAKEDAQARASLLADLQTWVRRGTIPSDFASGSGLSQIDTALDWADNTALSKATRAKLKQSALSYEKTLGVLTTNLDKANTDLATVKGIYDDVYSNLSKAGSALSDLGQATTTQNTDLLGNISYTTTPASAASITAKKTAEGAKMGTFMAKVGQLQKLGAGTAFLSELAEIAGSDVDYAISLADSYLSDTSQIALMNSAYDQMTAYAKGTAEFVTDSAYQGGLAAAQGVVDTLTGSLTSLGEQMAASFAAALGKVVVGGSVQSKPKKKAGGGSVYAGDSYVVNEQGMEIFRPAVNGIILTAGQSQQAIGSGVSAGDIARAFSGIAMTLMVDGKPVRAIVQTELSAEAASLRNAQGW